MTTSVQEIEKRVINNITFTIYSVNKLEYDGKWDHSGYLVEFNGKTKTFIGYPTTEDLKNETS